MKKLNYYLGMCCFAATLGYSSCIGDDDDIILNENVENIEIDQSFKASQDFLQASWRGEYSGRDENQKAETNIKRLLILNKNGTYINRIQGILVNKTSNKTEYTDFEIEKGSYTYDGSSVIRYKVEVDSLINYQTEKLEYFSKKHSYSGSSTDTSKDVSTYTEEVQFQNSNGYYQWVTKDVYLSNIKGDDLDLIFIMNKI